jgi:ArsR family transcriptional regulator, arsenate/arsenite/antimonite-responsive transcriptional repressor
MNDAQAIAAFSALGNDIRFAAWRLLLPYGPAGLPAGVVAERVGLRPSSMTFHLRTMTNAGLLSQRRVHRRNIIFYAVNPEATNALVRLLASSSWREMAARGMPEFITAL